MVDEELAHCFERDGRVWLRNAISAADLARFDRVAETSSKPGKRLQISGGLAELLSEGSSLTAAIGGLEPQAKPVRAVAFNKTEEANWGLPWHQDRIIAVAEPHDLPGFGTWTQKSGAWHCEPPAEVLERMLFVRVHLDDGDPANGAMRIAVGSHRAGLVPYAEADRTAAGYPVEDCAAVRGDVLVLKMLTLHASNPAAEPSARRVLRIDFAAFDLPPPLGWAAAP
ncbi:MAG: phytanoyl-CoA dioxygenase family protein [Pseudomonadota bacterium]